MTPSLHDPSGHDPALNGDGQECFVVCVDDDPEFVRSLELFLPYRINEDATSGPEHRFLFFTDPQDALESLNEIATQRGILAMVISDQQMPRMKGTAFLAKIRERYPDSIRVLLTGHAGLESAIAAINEQLLDKYLTKPVDNEHDFTVSIKLLLQRFWMQRTIAAQRRTIGDLYEFSNALNALANLPSTLEQVMAFGRNALDCGHASIWLIEGQELVGAGDGADAWSPAHGPLDPVSIERLADSRVIRIAKGSDAPWFVGLGNAGAERLPAYPFMQSTLAWGSQALGILVVGDKTNKLPFDAHDEEILSYVADTASIAIYNRLQSAELAQAYKGSRDQAIALASANRRLRLLDRLKDDFLTFVSHELRTPVTVLSAVELLDPPADRADQIELVGALRNGYERLRKFIETALAYGTLIAGQQQRSFEALDLGQLVRLVVEEFEGPEGADPDIQATITGLPCPVRGNRSNLAEVVRILLQNAIKFSPDEKRIRVTCETSGDHVSLCVADKGIGFAPELAEELLRPFTIADSLHHQSGTALNLAKAAAIVIASGGEIRAESAGAGLGASFVVRLPLADPEPAGVSLSPAPNPGMKSTPT
jgi:signal transduction histidine kinase/FixJ family two-component response regulator